MQKQFMGVAALGAALAIGDASHAQAVQWRVEDGGNGHWYQLIVSGPISWANARLACESLGGHLATPRSATEDSFILNISNRSSYPSAWVNDFGGNAAGPWLGGFQPENASPIQPWAWVTGEPWSWAGWAAGEPNGGFVPGLQTTLMLGYAGSNFYRGWGDISSDMIPPYPGSNSYIVEWSADCNDDGIIDYGQCRDGSLPDFNSNNVPDCCEAGQACVVGSYPVQWRASEGGNGHWYEGRRLPIQLTWASARSIARAAGGDLASLGSASKSQWMFERVARRTALWTLEYAPPYIVGPWMGGRGINGVWVWTDGSTWSFANWYPGEGGVSSIEQYVHLYGGIGTQIIPSPRWADFWNEPMSRSLVIEWSDDCNNDGIVDKGQILSGQFADLDNDGIPNVCECVCDVFRDLNVNGIDLAVLLGQWGAANQFTVTDFNGDGAVDGIDLGQLLAAWGPCPN